MSYDSASLTTPDIKWLGLRPSDLNKYELPNQCRLDMTENDIKTGNEMLKEDFIQKNPEWMKELEIMVSVKRVHGICVSHGRHPAHDSFCPGENEKEGRNSGLEQLWFSIYHGALPSSKAERRRLDLTNSVQRQSGQVSKRQGVGG